MNIIDLNRKRADRDGTWTVPDTLRDLAGQVEAGEIVADHCVAVLMDKNCDKIFIWKNGHSANFVILGMLDVAQEIVRAQIRGDM